MKKRERYKGEMKEVFKNWLEELIAIIIIIILCSIDSGNVDAQPTPLYESRH